MPEKRAHLIAELDGYTGDARLYKVVPPLAGRPDYSDDEPSEPETHDYVIVSKTVVQGLFGGAETYIFAADPTTWKVKNFSKMPGSLRGDFTHAEVLERLGYTII